MPVPQNSIVVNAGSDSKFLQGVAAEIIYPGHYLIQNANGEYIKCNYGANTVCPTIVAVEDTTRGLTVDEPYAVGDMVLDRYFRAGDLHYALLAPSETVVYYESLGISAVAGEVEASAASLFSVGHALEAKTSGVTAELILVECRT